MISLAAPSSKPHTPQAAIVAADVEVHRWESDGGAIVNRRSLSATPTEMLDVDHVSPSRQIARTSPAPTALRQVRETNACVRAILTVIVTITTLAVAALIISSILFEGKQILLAAGAGTMVMTFVGLSALLAAIGDITGDAMASVDASCQNVNHADKSSAAGIPTARPTRDTLVPGRRVRVIHQIPKRKACWTSVIEGTIVEYRQAPTGSWFAHSRNHKLWLDRLELRRDDGELTSCILDSYTRIEFLDDAT